ncbi:hypothetical protein T492DRAFT_944889 [Pavlovales sp. CCMP2436]|nr:hypothetical protein T492DRAFT_944889 [Pavlovales sp. CCMP2436]
MVDGEAKAAEAMHHSNPLYRQIGASSLVPEEATLHYQNDDIEDIYERMDNAIPLEKVDAYEAWVRALLIHAPTTDAELMAAMVTLRRQFRGQPSPKKFELLHVYNALLRRREIEAFPEVARTLVAKGVRSQSGVLVITVLTTPYPTVNGKKQAFSCQWDCYYCPNQPGQPRSYLRDEPAVLRANENGFDAVLQFTDRAATLAANGHPVDKIELLVLGGTWESYPRAYQETFVRDLFYAANTFWQRPKDKRARLALQEEININEHTAVKIIGLTLETRPDTISQSEIRRLRRYGCTRIQLGIQHVDDNILELINRGAYDSDTVRALRLLKDACFKVDVHLMPNLPGATPDLDTAMFKTMSFGADHQADQWKVYPCEVTPWTVIHKWHAEGSFVPYPDEQLVETILDAKERGQRCNCIRCREVAGKCVEGTPELVERRYIASGGDEVFLSVETADRATIFGFLRLRVSRHSRTPFAQRYWPRLPLRIRSEKEWGVVEEPKPHVSAGTPVRRRPRVRKPVADEEESGEQKESGSFGAAALQAEGEEDISFPELAGAGLVRELHVYGQLVQTAKKAGSADQQHTGHGKLMMARAEWLCAKAGCETVAVISGVGARGYYRKLGYEMHPGEGAFMLKRLKAFASRTPLALLAALAAATLAGALAGIFALLQLQQARLPPALLPPPPQLGGTDAIADAAVANDSVLAAAAAAAEALVRTLRA